MLGGSFFGPKKGGNAHQNQNKFARLSTHLRYIFLASVLLNSKNSVKFMVVHILHSPTHMIFIVNGRQETCGTSASV